MIYRFWEPGDRFIFIRFDGKAERGVVLEVEDDIVVGRLDGRRDGEECYFHRCSPYVVKEDI